MLEIYDKLKVDNEDKIIFINKGIFYYCFFKDAYIVYYLKNYKMIDHGVSFPNNVLDKIVKLLKEYNIGYLIYDNYIVDKSYGDNECYLKYLSLGMEKVKKDIIVSKIINLGIEDFNKLVSICLDIGIKL